MQIFVQKYYEQRIYTFLPYLGQRKDFQDQPHQAYQFDDRNQILFSEKKRIELLKSKSFMAACLKTPYKNDSNYCLADAYADVYKLRKKWQTDDKIGRAIYFAQPDKDLRLQDSLLKTIVKRIEEKEIGVVKVDKKLGFFNVQNYKSLLMIF